MKSEISEVMIFLIYLLSSLSENRIPSPSAQVVIETHSPLPSNSVIKFNLVTQNYDQIIILYLRRQVMTHTTGRKWLPSLTASLSPTILPSLGQCHMAFHWPWVQWGQEMNLWTAASLFLCGALDSAQLTVSILAASLAAVRLPRTSWSFLNWQCNTLIQLLLT